MFGIDNKKKSRIIGLSAEGDVIVGHHEKPRNNAPAHQLFVWDRTPKPNTKVPETVVEEAPRAAKSAPWPSQQEQQQQQIIVPPLPPVPLMETPAISAKFLAVSNYEKARSRFSLNWLAKVEPRSDKISLQGFNFDHLPQEIGAPLGQTHYRSIGHDQFVKTQAGQGKSSYINKDTGYWVDQAPQRALSMAHENGKSEIAIETRTTHKSKVDIVDPLHAPPESHNFGLPKSLDGSILDVPYETQARRTRFRERPEKFHHKGYRVRHSLSNIKPDYESWTQQIADEKLQYHAADINVEK